MKFIFHRNQLRVEKRPVMRPVSQSCHRRSITFPQTVNGQLRNGESFVRFNHPSHVLEAAKCSSTTTLPPVCLTRRDDNRSRLVSADDCVTWNVNNNFAVSSSEACGTDSVTLKEPQNNSWLYVSSLSVTSDFTRVISVQTTNYYFGGKDSKYNIQQWYMHARWRLLYSVVYCIIISRIFKLFKNAPIVTT